MSAQADRYVIALTDIANDSCTCMRSGECHVCIAREALRPVCPACASAPCVPGCDEGDVAKADAAEPRS